MATGPPDASRPRPFDHLHASAQPAPGRAQTDMQPSFLTRKHSRWHRLVAASLTAALTCGALPGAQAQSPRRASAGPTTTTHQLESDDTLAGTMSSMLAHPVDAPKAVDYIVAVVNQDPITYSEVQQRMSRAIQDAPAGTKLPPPDVLRKQILDNLIDERVQLDRARQTGLQVEPAELDAAIRNIAEQNQISLEGLRERLRKDNIDYAQFRDNVRDRILLDRVRERDVPPRIRVSDADVDAYIKEQLGSASTERELSLAQILIKVPEGASDKVVEARRTLAEQVLAKALKGDDFIKLAHDYSDDAATKEQGGQLGWRGVSRLPDSFVNAAMVLKQGEVDATLLRSDAGFHIIKLMGRRDALNGYTVVQSHARHILIRPSSDMSLQAAQAELESIRNQIVTGQASFAQLARQYSQDGTATKGGDLGWSTTGMFVPEFQKALDALQPGQISQPVATRFGLHLIQLMERREVPIDPKQLRENARNALREQRFESTYLDWARELRAQAYIEIRDPPSE